MGNVSFIHKDAPSPPTPLPRVQGRKKDAPSPPTPLPRVQGRGEKERRRLFHHSGFRDADFVEHLTVTLALNLDLVAFLQGRRILLPVGREAHRDSEWFAIFLAGTLQD